MCKYDQGVSSAYIQTVKAAIEPGLKTESVITGNPPVDFDFKFRVEPEAGHPAWIIERF